MQNQTTLTLIAIATKIGRPEMAIGSQFLSRPAQAMLGARMLALAGKNRPGALAALKRIGLAD